MNTISSHSSSLRIRVEYYIFIHPFTSSIYPFHDNSIQRSIRNAKHNMIYILIGNKNPYTYTLLKPNWKENHTTTTHTHTRRTLKLVTIVKKPCSCILSDRYFFRVKVFFSIPIGTCGLIMASTTSYESCCVAGTNKNMHIAWAWWWQNNGLSSRSTVSIV